VLSNTPDNFVGGKIADHLADWKMLTSDAWILRKVDGVDVQLLSDSGTVRNRDENFFPSTEREQLHIEIDTLLKKGVITKTEPSSSEVISNNF